MIDIDETSGLPRLPEGYFWRVGEYYVEVREWKPDTNWELERDYQRSYNYSGRVETREVIVRPGSPFRREKKRKEFRVTNRSVEAYTIYPPDPVTRENVASLCEKALQEWTERENRKKIYGDYPPKKL